MGVLLRLGTLLFAASAAPQFPTGVTQVGHGVDIFSAIPDGQIDCKDTVCPTAGLSLSPVFDMSAWNERQVVSGDVKVPDGWGYVQDVGCDLQADSTVIHDWFDYQTTVDVYKKKTFWFLFIPFSHTETFHAINRITRDSESVLLRQQAQCTAYRMSRNRLDGSAVLMPEFKEMVATIPTDPAEYNASTQVIWDFVQKYGTHIINSATFGGKVTLMSQMSQNNYTHMKRQWGSLRDSSLLNLVCNVGDHVLCDPNNPAWEEMTDLRQHTASEFHSYVPQMPPLDPEAGRGLHKWSEAVLARPDIIDYDLDLMSEVLTPQFFPDDELITARAALVERFLTGPDLCHFAGCPDSTTSNARWEEQPDMPAPRAAAVVVTGSAPDRAVQIVGGTDGVTDDNADVPVLQWKAGDIGLGSWAYSSSLSVVDGSRALTYSAGTWHKGVFYITGGHSDSDDLSRQVFQFTGDPMMPWLAADPLLQPREAHCAASVGGHLVVLAGQDRWGRAVLQVETYHDSAWSERGQLPEGNSGLKLSSCMVYDGKVFVVGGFSYSTQQATGEVLTYEPVRDQWEVFPSPMHDAQIPRLGAAIALVGHHLLLLGGLVTEDDAPLDDVQVLQLPSAESPTPQWFQGCPLPQPLAHASAFTVNELNGSAEVHLIGGFNLPQGGNPSPLSLHTILRIPDAQGSGMSSLLCKLDGAAQPALGSHYGLPQPGPAPPLLQRDLPSVHPGTGFLGQGFASTTGGFVAQRVLDTECEDCFAGNVQARGLRIPDAAEANFLERCSYNSRGFEVHDGLDLQAELDADAKLNAYGGIPILLMARFTANAHFGANMKALHTYKNTFVTAKAQCIGSQMQLSSRGSSVPLSKHFRNAVLALPSTGDPPDQSKYRDFLKAFGDHVVTGLDHGAQLSQVHHMTEASYSEALSSHIDLKVHAGFNVLLIFGYGVTQGGSVDLEQHEQFTKLVSSNHTHCTPLCPPLQANASTNSTAWLDTIMPVSGPNGERWPHPTQAAPVSLRVVPIVDVLDPSMFDEQDREHVRGVKQALQTLLDSGAACDATSGCDVPAPQPYWATVPLNDGEGLFVPQDGEVTNSGLALFPGDLLVAAGGQVQDATGSSATGATRLAQVSKGGPVEWQLTAPLPTPRWNFAAVQAERTSSSLLYAVGGEDGQGPLDAVEVFDVQERVWSAAPSLSAAISEMGAVVVDDVLVAVGGRAQDPDGRQSANCVAHMLDFSKPTEWQVGTHQLPESCVRSPGVVRLPGERAVAVFGGTIYDSSTCSDAVLRYDLDWDEWRVLWRMPWASCVVKAVPMADTGALLMLGDDLTQVLHVNLTSGIFAPHSDMPFSGVGSALSPPTSFGDAFIVGPPTTRVLRNAAPAASPTASQSPMPLPAKQDVAQAWPAPAAPQAALPTGAAAASGDASRRFPNVDALKFGYNTLLADPFTPGGSDPGWSSEAVFNFSAAEWVDSQMYLPSDGVKWQLPSGMLGIGAESSCDYVTKTLSLHHTWDYRKFMQSLHQFGGKAKSGITKLIHLEYSAALTWQSILETQLKLNGTVQLSLGICNRYALSHKGPDPGLPFTEHFVQDLEALPMTYDESHDAQFLEFVHKYGLYLPTEANFGAMVAELSVLGEADFLAMMRAGLDVQAGAKAHLFIFFGMHANAAAEGDLEAALSFGAGLHSDRVACLPRCPPAGPDVKNRPEDWATELAVPHGGIVAPTKLTLTPLGEAVLDMKARLPQQLQGEQLEKRIAALNSFVEGPLAFLTPGAKNATSRPFVVADSNLPSTIAKVQRSASATLDGILYVLGGFVDETASNMMQIYDPASGSWSTGPDMPKPRTEATAVALKDQLYVCGGLDDSGNVLADCDAFDPSTGRWEAGVSQMNEARVAHAGAVLDGSYYVFGGYAMQEGEQLTNPLDSIEVLALDTGNWTTLNATLPESLGHMAAVTLNGRIHLAGGDSRAHFQRELLPPFSAAMATFDGEDLTASDVALPLPRSGAHLVPTPDGGLILAGGYGQVHAGDSEHASPVAKAQIFSPTTRSWGRGPELPWPVRHGVASMTDDGRMVHFVGGIWDPEDVSQVENGVVTMQIGATDVPLELGLPKERSIVELMV